MFKFQKWESIKSLVLEMRGRAKRKSGRREKEGGNRCFGLKVVSVVSVVVVVVFSEKRKKLASHGVVGED